MKPFVPQANKNKEPRTKNQEQGTKKKSQTVFHSALPALLPPHPLRCSPRLRPEASQVIGTRNKIQGTRNKEQKTTRFPLCLKRLAASSVSPPLGSRKQSIRNQEPRTKNQEQRTRNQELGTKNQELRTRNKLPSHRPRFIIHQLTPAPRLVPPGRWPQSSREVDCGTPHGASGAMPQPKAVSNGSDPSPFAVSNGADPPAVCHIFLPLPASAHWKHSPLPCKNKEQRTRNQERGTKNEEPRTRNRKPSTKLRTTVMSLAEQIQQKSHQNKEVPPACPSRSALRSLLRSERND